MFWNSLGNMLKCPLQTVSTCFHLCVIACKSSEWFRISMFLNKKMHIRSVFVHIFDACKVLCSQRGKTLFRIEFLIAILVFRSPTLKLLRAFHFGGCCLINRKKWSCYKGILSGRKENFPFFYFYGYCTAWRTRTSFVRRPSNRSSGSILVASDLACEGLGCVSINNPSATQIGRASCRERV